MSTLLIGAGNSITKKIFHELTPAKEFDDLITLDITGMPDILWDLNNMPYPFKDESFDEIHAYEVLEHCGIQGDEKFFFDQFNEFHRILKPGGVLCGSVPHHTSIWAWGDPGHKRVLPEASFHFLQKEHYDQLGNTSCADYRHLIKGYWKLIGIQEGEVNFFLLQK